MRGNVGLLREGRYSGAKGTRCGTGGVGISGGGNDERGVRYGWKGMREGEYREKKKN